MSFPEARRVVTICMMKGEDADATVASVRESQPDVQAVDRGTYWMLEGTEEIVLDIEDISDRLGRTLTVGDLLVSFSSFVGRADVTDEHIRVTSEMLQIET